MASRVGFIGLGRMGGPMARQLARAGHAVAVYDSSAAAAEALRDAGDVAVAGSPAEVAGQCRVVFTALPNNAVVREVYLGDRGIAAGGAEGLVTCDCSTVSPELTVALHRALAGRGIHHLDTPMLGSAPQAETGEVFFIVGGEEAYLPAARPYLEVMGKMHRHVGPPGAGNWIKLVHNALGAVNAVAVAEALAVCASAEVDLEHFYQVVTHGGGMAYSTYFDRRVQRIVAGEYSPTFTVELMHKDIGLARELAERVGVPAPVMEETRRTFAEALEHGWGGEDFSGVTHVVERRIGRKISDRKG